MKLKNNYDYYLVGTRRQAQVFGHEKWRLYVDFTYRLLLETDIPQEDTAWINEKLYILVKGTGQVSDEYAIRGGLWEAAYRIWQDLEARRANIKKLVSEA